MFNDTDIVDLVTQVCFIYVGVFFYKMSTIKNLQRYACTAWYTLAQLEPFSAICHQFSTE